MDLKPVRGAEPRLFVRATGTMETPGLGNEPMEVGPGRKADIGKYCSNNSTLAFVDAERVIYVGPATADAIGAVEEAGYTRGDFRVPHSNDCGRWMRTKFSEF